jgi:hypothetical protein
MLKPTILFLAILFTSCSSKHARASSNEQALFTKPKGIYEKSVYQLTKPFIYAWAHPASSETLFTLSGYKKQKNYALEFWRDIGAESIQIKTHDKALIDGIYINPQIFQAKKSAAFKKWKAKLGESQYKKLASIFEANVKATNFESLFGFPDNIQPKKMKKKMGVLCLPACGLIYELDPKYILNFVLRGFHVVSINYRGLVNSRGLPNWKGTCLDGKYAFEWLKRTLHVNNRDMIATGKSFGCGPAVYTASTSPGANLMIDRGFSRLSDVCTRNFSRPMRFLLTPFGRYFVEKYYRFPNDELIKSVTGRFLLIEARQDNYMRGQAEKLMNSYLDHQKELDTESALDLKKRSHIQVSGGHFGIRWGDSIESWYSDRASQEKLNLFFKEIVK